ncbi:hypothetical protein C8Q80DRAFT_1269574 [Daedaleopsis nitida]|nr:hypothetical protein C8Q80DRAFT_1269574 [Daedaleopsis nitida]
MPTLRCPATILSAVRDLEDQFFTAKRNMFLQNDDVPVELVGRHGDATVTLVKYWASSKHTGAGSLTSREYLTYKISCEAGTAYEEDLTVHIENPHSSREVNAEAVSRAIQYLLYEPDHVEMASFKIAVDPNNGHIEYIPPRQD